MHLIAKQLSSGWQHNYSTKTRQVGRANEQSMYSLMSLVHALKITILSITTLLSITAKRTLHSGYQHWGERIEHINTNDTHQGILIP